MKLEQIQNLVEAADNTIPKMLKLLQSSDLLNSNISKNEISKYEKTATKVLNKAQKARFVDYERDFKSYDDTRKSDYLVISVDYDIGGDIEDFVKDNFDRVIKLHHLTRDVDDMEQEYQGWNEDPDAPDSYIESSDYLRALDDQRKIGNIMGYGFMYMIKRFNELEQHFKALDTYMHNSGERYEPVPVDVITTTIEVYVGVITSIVKYQKRMKKLLK